MHIALRLTHNRTDHGVIPRTQETYLARIEADGDNSLPDARSTEITIDWPTLRPYLYEFRCDASNIAIRTRIGNALRECLRGTDWNLYEARIRSLYRSSDDTIHLTIRANEDAVLALPWNLLPLDGLGLSLGALDQVVIGYAVSGVTPVEERRASRRRVLFAWSARGGRVPAQAHLTALTSACSKAEPSLAFSADEDTLAEVTPRYLHEELSSQKRPQVAALHLLCHGSVTETGYRLCWASEDGATAQVAPDDVAAWLAPYASTLRVVTICACASARTPAHEQRVGELAQALHRVGIPWVIGSQHPFSKAGSVRFSELFYNTITAPGNTIELGFQRARKQLSFDVYRIDHIGLKLYASSQDRGREPFIYADKNSPLAHIQDRERQTATTNRNAPLEQFGKRRLLVDRALLRLLHDQLSNDQGPASSVSENALSIGALVQLSTVPQEFVPSQ